MGSLLLLSIIVVNNLFIFAYILNNFSSDRRVLAINYLLALGETDQYIIECQILTQQYHVSNFTLHGLRSESLFLALYQIIK